MKPKQKIGSAVTQDIAGAFALMAEMTREFTASLDIETALAQALTRIATHLDAEAGSLWLLDPDGRVAGTDDSDSLRSSGLSVEPSYRSISGAGAMCTV